MKKLSVDACESPLALYGTQYLSMRAANHKSKIGVEISAGHDRLS